MEKIDRIGVLLDFYGDVVSELRDRGGVCSRPPDRCPNRDCGRMRLCIEANNVLPMKCAAWNHPSYRELERLRPVLKERWPLVYGHMATRYFKIPLERRVARCKCGETRDASWIDRPHGHKVGRSGSFAPHVEKILGHFDPAIVADGLDWFDRHWRGEAELPREIRDILHQRAVRQLAAA